MLTAQQVIARGDDALGVEVRIGEFVVRSDMPAARGGKNTAPPPGSVMRAAVAACLAVGYKQWGQKLGVSIADVEVDLTTDIDMRGQEGTADAPPGWQGIRWHVRVTSPADRTEVERVLAHAERLSPMLDTLHPRCTRTRTFEVKVPQ